MRFLNAFKRRAVFAVLGVSVLCVAGYALRTPEPTYQNRRLSSWLRDFDGGTNSPRNAAAALEKMGTNIYPQMVRMLHVRDSGFKLKLIELSKKQHLIDFGLTPAIHQHRRVLDAFQALGSRATPAIPALLQLCEHNDDSDRLNAVMCLGYILEDPDRVVPALTIRLRDSSFVTRKWVAIVLGRYGERARAAIPELRKLTEDADPAVRMIAQVAIRQIDPDAARAASSRAANEGTDRTSTTPVPP